MIEFLKRIFTSSPKYLSYIAEKRYRKATAIICGGCEHTEEVGETSGFAHYKLCATLPDKALSLKNSMDVYACPVCGTLKII